MKQIATWIEPKPWPDFERMFAAYPDMALRNARDGDVPEEPDGLLLSGGDDIGVEFLRQPVPDPALIREPNAARDAWEFGVLPKALARRIPVFAICRGLQVLNVALGGTLLLDIPGHGGHRRENVQALVYGDGAVLRVPLVNSSHHQALDRLGVGLEVEARSAGDGVIEQARLRDYPFGLGVQYHPERDEIYRPLFDAFVEAVRRGKA